MKRAATLIKGIVALALLVALAAAVPWALWHYVGWPLPHRLPSWSQFTTAMGQHGIPDTTLLKALACVVWIAWAILVASLAVELPAAVRGTTARRAAITGPIQPLVGHLLAAVIVAVLAVAPRPTAAIHRPLATAGGPGRPREPVAALALAADVQPAIPMPHIGIFDTPPLPSEASESSSRVYVVQPNETLWGIAERELGDPLRWSEIYALNAGRPEPDGKTLEDPHWIYPGWTLMLPDAGTAPPTETPAAPAPSLPDLPAGVTPAIAPQNGDGAVAYAVRPGDSLWRIAQDHLGAGQDWHVIWEANRDHPEPAGATLDDPSVIRPGWELTIPGDGPAQAPPVAAPGPPPAAAPPSPPAPITTGPASAGSTGESTHRSAVPSVRAERPGIELPGGYLVGATLGLAVGAALATARLHRRRRRVPVDPRPSIAFEDPLSAPTVERLQRPRHQDEESGDANDVIFVGDAPSPGVVAFGRFEHEELQVDLRGGVSLIGDDRRFEVARAAALSLLAQPPDDTHLVIAGRDLAVELFGDSSELPGLKIAEDLPGALRQAEVELVSRNRILDQLEVPDADTLAQRYPEERFVATVIVAARPSGQQAGRLGAVLSAGRHLALGGLLLYNGPADVRLEIGGDRQLIGVAPPEHPLAGARGAQLYGIGKAEAAEVVSTIASGRGRVPDDDALPEVAFAAPDPAGRAILVVRLLGGCRISTCKGVEVVQLREKAKELLAYLLANPDGVPTERAIEALWPEVEPRAGRDRFRTVLSNLRGQLADALGELGPPPVERIGAVCRVDTAAIDCDLWRFEAALSDARDTSAPEQKRAAYASAANAYGGDLLDGADCAWVEAPREKLRDLAVGALCRLAELAQAEGDDDAAVTALERAVDLDPYGEETARRLIDLQGQSGNPDAARRVYRRLNRVLQDDLDVDPSPETRALLEDIVRRSRERAGVSITDQ